MLERGRSPWPLVANARELYERDPEWHTEPLLFVESTNVLATVSCYDARFITAATALGCRLVTEDAKLRAKAPALTWSIAEALAARGER